jgi:hypothetical protein
MGLKEIKDRVEREHPDWDGSQKLAEMKRLRAEERAAKKGAPVEPATEGAPAADGDKPTPATVGEAWAFLAVIVIGMRLIGWAVWRDVFDEPHWYDVLHAVLIVVGICAVVGAYKRRSASGQ